MSMNKETIVCGFCLNTEEIVQYLEVTPPFLMIDYVENIIPGKSSRGIKKLSRDDWFFSCHLQQQQAMPGSLQIEAMLQTLVLTIYTIDGQKGKISYVTEIKTKLFSKVTPDCELIIDASLLSYKRGLGKGVTVGKVNGVVVCQGEFTLISPHEIPHPRIRR